MCTTNDFYSEFNLNPQEIEAFKQFTSNSENTSELELISQQLNQKYAIAKTFAENIVQCQKNILAIRKALENNNCSGAIFEDLNAKLCSQQSTYREAILQLQNLRKETDHLKHGLQQARIKLIQKFREAEKKQNERKQVEIFSKSEQKENGVLKESCKSNASLERVKCSTPENKAKTVTPVVSVAENEKTIKNLERMVVGEEVCENDFVAEPESLSIIETKVSDNPESISFETNETNKYFLKFLEKDDSNKFVDFMKTVPLTGDDEVDYEIFNFYRTKFNYK